MRMRADDFDGVVGSGDGARSRAAAGDRAIELGAVDVDADDVAPVRDGLHGDLPDEAEADHDHDFTELRVDEANPCNPIAATVTANAASSSLTSSGRRTAGARHLHLGVVHRIRRPRTRSPNGECFGRPR